MNDSEFYKLVGSALSTLMKSNVGEVIPLEELRQQVLKTIIGPVDIGFEKRLNTTLMLCLEDNSVNPEHNNFYEKMGMPIPKEAYDAFEQMLEVEAIFLSKSATKH